MLPAINFRESINSSQRKRKFAENETTMIPFDTSSLDSGTATPSLCDSEESLEPIDILEFPTVQSNVVFDDHLFDANTCDVIPIIEPSPIAEDNDYPQVSSSPSHTLFDTTKINSNHHKKRTFMDDMDILDAAYDEIIDMIDPLPLPPSHGNIRQSVSPVQSNDSVFLEPTYVPSSQNDMNLDTSISKLTPFPPDRIPSLMKSYRQTSKPHETLKNDHSIFLKNALLGLTSPLYCQEIMPENAFPIVSLSGGDSSSMWSPPPGKNTTTNDTSLKSIFQDIHSDKTDLIDPPPATKPSMLMSMKCDKYYLSEYQCLVREQIEIFEASEEEVLSRDRGRNCAIVKGQVGIRCKHCARIPVKHRPRGASYYTSSLNGLYQAAQKMTTDHFFKHCRHIPPSVKASLLVLKKDRRRASDGKRYWAEGARSLGIRETGRTGLRLVNKPKGGDVTPV